MADIERKTIELSEEQKQTIWNTYNKNLEVSKQEGIQKVNNSKKTEKKKAEAIATLEKKYSHNVNQENKTALSDAIKATIGEISPEDLIDVANGIGNVLNEYMGAKIGKGIVRLFNTGPSKTMTLKDLKTVQLFKPNLGKYTKSEILSRIEAFRKEKCSEKNNASVIKHILQTKTFVEDDTLKNSIDKELSLFKEAANLVSNYISSNLEMPYAEYENAQLYRIIKEKGSKIASCFAKHLRTEGGIDLQEYYLKSEGLMTNPASFEASIIKEVISKYKSQLNQTLNISFVYLNGDSEEETKQEQLAKFLSDYSLTESDKDDITESLNDEISSIQTGEFEDEKTREKLLLHYKTLSEYFESHSSKEEIEEIIDRVIIDVIRNNKTVVFKSDTLPLQMPTNRDCDRVNKSFDYSPATSRSTIFERCVFHITKVTTEEHLSDDRKYIIWNKDIYAISDTQAEDSEELELLRYSHNFTKPSKHTIEILIYNTDRTKRILQKGYAIFGQDVKIKRDGHKTLLYVSYNMPEDETPSPDIKSVTKENVCTIDLGQKHNLITTNLPVGRVCRLYVNIHQALLQDPVTFKLLKEIKISLDKDCTHTYADVFDDFSKTVQFLPIELPSLLARYIYRTDVDYLKDMDYGFTKKDFIGGVIVQKLFSDVEASATMEGMYEITQGHTWDMSRMSKSFKERKEALCLLDNNITRVLKRLEKEYGRKGMVKQRDYVSYVINYRKHMAEYFNMKNTYRKYQKLHDLNVVAENVENPCGIHNPIVKDRKGREMTNGQVYLKEHPFSETPEAKKILLKLTKIEIDLIGCRDNILRYAYATLEQSGICVCGMENLTSSQFDMKHYIPSPYTLMNPEKNYNVVGKNIEKVENMLKAKRISPLNYVFTQDEDGNVKNVEFSQQGALHEKLSYLYNVSAKVSGFASVKDVFIQLSYRRGMKVALLPPFYSSRMDYDEKEGKFIIYYVESKDGKRRLASKRDVRRWQEYHLNGKNADVNACDVMDKYITNPNLFKVFMKKGASGYGNPAWEPKSICNTLESFRKKMNEAFQNEIDNGETPFVLRPIEGIE